jgi:hypothetical protein
MITFLPRKSRKHTLEPSCAMAVKSGACDPTASICGLLSSRPIPSLTSVKSDIRSPPLRGRRGRSLTRPRSLRLRRQRAPSLTGALPLTTMAAWAACSQRFLTALSPASQLAHPRPYHLMKSPPCRCVQPPRRLRSPAWHTRFRRATVRRSH